MLEDHSKKAFVDTHMPLLECRFLDFFFKVQSVGQNPAPPGIYENFEKIGTTYPNCFDFFFGMYHHFPNLSYFSSSNHYTPGSSNIADTWKMGAPD